MPMGGGSGGAGDIQAGGAFVRIYSKDDLTKTLDRLRAKFNSFGSFINSVGSKALLGGTALLAPITALFAGGVNRAAHVGKLAEQFGIGAEQMSRFAFAAEDAGVSLEEVIMNQERFAAAMARAPVFDAQAAADALATQRAFKDVTVSLQAAMLPLLQFMAPLVQQFAAFVKENKHLLFVVAGVGAGLLAVGAAAKAVAAGIAITTAALAALKFAVAFLSPGGILAAGLIAVGALLLKDTDAVKQLGKDFAAMGDTAKEAWGGIVAALKKGDIELAADIAFAAVESLWHEMIVAMGRAFDNLFKTVFGRFAELAKAIAFIGGGALAGAAVGGMLAGVGAVPGAIAGAGAGALAWYLKESMQAASEIASPAARARLRTLTTRAGEPGFITGRDESSIHAKLNAANIKGAFQGPLGQQLGIGDTFQKKLLATAEKSEGWLESIYKEMERGGVRFS